MRGGEVRAMMREKCTEKGRHSMPGNIRKNPAYNAGLTDEGGESTGAAVNRLHRKPERAAR